MKFKTKIGMLPACAAGVFIVGLAISYVVGMQTSQALHELRAVNYPYKELVAEVDGTVEDLRRKFEIASRDGDAQALKEADEIIKSVQDPLGRLGKLEGKAEVHKALADAVAAYASSGVAATGAVVQKADAASLTQKMQADMAELQKLLAKGREESAASVNGSQERAASGVDLGLWVGLGTGVAVLLMLGLASKLILRSVWRDLGDEPSALRERVQRIADGDLSTHASDTVARVEGSLLASVEQMSRKLNATVGQIRLSTESIWTASSEIAAGNQDLSNRTEQTASNLQQAAASMEQLTGTVRQSAESAHQANALSGTAAEAAQRGGEIVSQVVASMDEINASSRKISEIIGVIDGIAFQTNILALNAAVEAARAGEQGRGFAVVAGEVRSLAQRSAEAAKEIKTLINASSEKVDSGTRLVQDAGAAMQDIVSGVARVSSMIAEIGAATSEQASGIGNINTTVTELDQMTQQNSALVEESAAAAESLREQAKRLTDSVAAFRLDAEQGRSLPSALPVSPAKAPAPVATAAKAPAPATPSAPAAPAASKPAPAKPVAAPAAKRAAPPPVLKTPAAEPATPARPAAAATTATDDWETF